jgi:hypothetical protein
MQPMQHVPEDTITWFVLFQAPRAPARWWHRFLAPGYRHLMLVRSLAPDHAISIEHTGTALLVDHHAAPPVALVRRHAMSKAVHLVLAIDRPLPASVRASLRPPMTCVEVAKAALAITAPWIITPRQLARHLLQIGARPVSLPTITSP